MRAETSRANKFGRNKQTEDIPNIFNKVGRASISNNQEMYFQFFKNVLYNKQVDFNNALLHFNSFPTSVRVDTKLIKVHYLFQMLGTNWIFVRGEREHLRGFIPKRKFLNLRYALQSDN